MTAASAPVLSACTCAHYGWYDPRCACCNPKAGPPVDWKARAEAAEAKLAGLEAALRRHLLSFTDPKGGGELCGGCLRPSPCPDAALCGEEGP